MNTSRTLRWLPLVAAAASAAGLAHAQEEQGRVISSTPIVQQVAVPREVCSDEQVHYRGQKSGAGALLGAIAGGAAGNAIGDGSGRAAATAIGLIGGAILGNRIEGEPAGHSEIVRRCGSQTVYEPRTVAYDVVYEYAGRQYRTQMAQDPGRFVRLNVAPVDSLPPPTSSVYPARPQVRYETPAPTVIYGGYAPGYSTISREVVIIGGPRYVAPPPRWQPPGHRHHHHHDRYPDHRFRGEFEYRR